MHNIFAIIILAIFLSLPFITGSTFHQRCSKAGYVKYELEECIDRVSKGGRVYIKDEDNE